MNINGDVKSNSGINPWVTKSEAFLFFSFRPSLPRVAAMYSVGTWFETRLFVGFFVVSSFFAVERASLNDRDSELQLKFI
jgi:hypothetical protein